MAAKKNTSRKIAASVLSQDVRESGQILWTLRVDGNVKNVVTSASSSAAISRATTKYDKTLERLAKR